MPRRNGSRPYARLTQPLVREHGVLRPATWDEALDRAASAEADGHRPLARALVGHAIWIDRKELPPPAEGEYYVHDLIGDARVPLRHVLCVTTAGSRVDTLEHGLAAGICWVKSMTKSGHRPTVIPHVRFQGRTSRIAQWSALLPSLKHTAKEFKRLLSSSSMHITQHVHAGGDRAAPYRQPRRQDGCLHARRRGPPHSFPERPRRS